MKNHLENTSCHSLISILHISYKIYLWSMNLRQNNKAETHVHNRKMMSKSCFSLKNIYLSLYLSLCCSGTDWCSWPQFAILKSAAYGTFQVIVAEGSEGYYVSLAGGQTYFVWWTWKRWLWQQEECQQQDATCSVWRHSQQLPLSLPTSPNGWEYHLTAQQSSSSSQHILPWRCHGALKGSGSPH